MSALDTAARETAADLWPLERELDYQPLPAKPCHCEQPMLEPWDHGHHCFWCGHDVIARAATC